MPTPSTALPSSLSVFVGFQIDGFDALGLPVLRTPYFAFVSVPLYEVNINLRQGKTLVGSTIAKVDAQGNFSAAIPGTSLDSGTYLAEILISPPATEDSFPRPTTYLVEFAAESLPALAELGKVELGDVFGQMLEAGRKREV